MPNVQVLKAAAVESTVLRVAAYCRVSTDSDDQINSFMAQMHYYYSFIQQAENMTLVDIYADEGITGTSIVKRDEFNRMLRDCRAGKIDRIYVKSVQRFARNALDCLETIHLLKDLSVAVYFENDGIDTGSLNSELILYVKSAFAQSEALAGSKRVSTANRMRLESGRYTYAKAPFGYRIESNTLIPIPEEAEIVGRIYSLYLSGNGFSKIVAEMKKTANISGKLWSEDGIRYILSNEKYIGDSLFQKSFTPCVLPLKKQRNHGERDKYYVADTHKPIIDKADFYAVQEMLKQHKRNTTPRQPRSFSGKIYCSSCGCVYKKRTQGAEPYWVCTKSGAEGVHCNTRPISEEALKRTFINFYNRFRQYENFLLRSTITKLTEVKKQLSGNNTELSELDKQIAALAERRRFYAGLLDEQIMDYASYTDKCGSIERETAALRSRRKKLLNDDEAEQTLDALRNLREQLSDAPAAILEFDKGLFDLLIEKVTVEPKHLAFHLKCGLKLREVIAWN